MKRLCQLSHSIWPLIILFETSYSICILLWLSKFLFLQKYLWQISHSNRTHLYCLKQVGNATCILQRKGICWITYRYMMIYLFLTVPINMVYLNVIFAIICFQRKGDWLTTRYIKSKTHISMNSFLCLNMPLKTFMAYITCDIFDKCKISSLISTQRNTYHIVKGTCTDKTCLTTRSTRLARWIRPEIRYRYFFLLFNVLSY